MGPFVQVEQAVEHQGIKLDFNSTYFSHPLAEDGYTLSHKDEKIRRFWIRHAQACRHISAEMGRRLDSPCIHNLWIPDGDKDLNVDRYGYRKLLMESLDEIFQEALRLSGTANMVMIGDQLETDIRGANAFGLDSVLVGSGIVDPKSAAFPDGLRPKYYMDSIMLRQRRTGFI